MQEVTVRKLYRYPIKGMAGGPVEELAITDEGIEGDRDFALVGEDGALMDQKLTPKMASIAAQLFAGGAGLVLRHAKAGIYTHKVRREDDPVPATWVIDEFEGIDQGDEVADWISGIIGKQARLIKTGKPWTINFPVPDMALLHGKQKSKFTAASELSLTNLASLEQLNRDLDEPIPMDRFRSNIVVDGIGAYEEDEMTFLGNDHVVIQQVTPAERCPIITTDQVTGERPRNNIFAVLGETRKKTGNVFGSGLLFGNYMTVCKSGSLYIGDRLRTMEDKQGYV